MTKLASILKRVSVFFFAFVFLFCSVFLISQPKKVQAVVPAVAIGGAIIASFFAAAGVSLTANNITSSSSMNDVLNDLANQYSSSSGAPSIETEMAVKNAYNFYYSDKAGEAIISVSDRFSAWLNGFKNWLVSDYNITSNDTFIINDSFITDIDGNHLVYYSNVSTITGIPLSVVPIVQGSQSVFTLNSSNAFRITIGNIYNQYYYDWINVTVERLNENGQVIGSIYHNYRLTSHDIDFIKVYFYNNNNNLAVRISPTDSGVYTSGYDLGTNILINTLDINSIGLSGALTDGYSDFEQALSDAQSDAGADGQVAVNAGEVEVDKPYTQEKIADAILQNTIANTGVGTLVGGYTDEKEVEEENDVERLPTSAEIGDNIVLVDGLEDFFPFCIPWDLYNIIHILNVRAVAPKFTYKVDLSDTAINTEYEAELDLAPFESVAVVFRAFIIVAFLIFLILKTRDLIRG